MATKSREASDWTTPNRLCNVESLGEVILKIMQERESLSQGESVLQRRFPSSIYARVVDGTDFVVIPAF
jgi:hypothetical protein